jgi:hypothetical protein
MVGPPVTGVGAFPSMGVGAAPDCAAENVGAGGDPVGKMSTPLMAGAG